MKLKKMMKLMLKLEMARTNAALSSKNIEPDRKDTDKAQEKEPEIKLDGNVMVGNLTLEQHFKQIHGNLSKIQSTSGDEAKLVGNMSKSYKSLLQELQTTRKELQDMKLILNQVLEELSYKLPQVEPEPFMTIYTDASYDNVTDQGGYGIVSVLDNGVVTEDCGAVELQDEVDKMTICYCEAYAIIKALSAARDLGYKEILLYTDNLSVTNWEKMGNDSNCNEAQWFYRKITELKESMNINLMWLRRCTCDYNTRADKLAKDSLSHCNFLYYEARQEEQPA